MEKNKTRVFLTGATGVMGMAGLKEFMKYPDDYVITVLARGSKSNRKKLAPFQENGVKVIWGDLLDENSLRHGIENADIVLHVGGMVSPMADHFPEKTLEVNVGSMKKIAAIVKELELKEPSREIGVVYIGSVSQYGTRMPPNHWGSVADPLVSATNDAYATSKILAEKALRDANLKKWVSIRQTSILHGGLLKNALNPVAFHTPLNGVLEWITTEDSGRLLERICRPSVPSGFWGKAYNAGGGEPFRKVNMEFEKEILKALGCPPLEKIMEPNWFATKNFHGMWFKDSDHLDSILHYREPDNLEQALKRIKKELPFYFRLTPLAPSFLIKAIMKRVASHPTLGPLAWIKNRDQEKIQLFFGSLQEYQTIPSWDKYLPPSQKDLFPN